MNHTLPENGMRIHSFLGRWIVRMRELCKIVNQGQGITSKIRLLQVHVLNRTPNSFKRVFKLEKLTSRLWKNIIVEKSGIKYFLVDQESYSIICDENEQFIQSWLDPQKNEVFVDVGANIGKYAISFAKEAGKEGLAVAIEPNLPNFRVLRKNVFLNKLENVIFLPIAAWNTNTTLKLFIGHLAGHHSSKIDWRQGYLTVNARKLDDALGALTLNKVNWIKIDVEGAEYEVFEGMTEILRKFRPKIISEIEEGNILRFKDFIVPYGYGMIRISPFYEFNEWQVFRRFTYFVFLPMTHNES